MNKEIDAIRVEWKALESRGALWLVCKVKSRSSLKFKRKNTVWFFYERFTKNWQYFKVWTRWYLREPSTKSNIWVFLFIQSWKISTWRSNKEHPMKLKYGINLSFFFLHPPQSTKKHLSRTKADTTWKDGKWYLNIKDENQQKAVTFSVFSSKNYASKKARRRRKDFHFFISKFAKAQKSSEK